MLNMIQSNLGASSTVISHKSAAKSRRDGEDASSIKTLTEALELLKMDDEAERVINLYNVST